MTRILAIDPGETYGYAVLEVLRKEPPLLLSVGEMRGKPLNEFVLPFLRLLQQMQPTAVILENYRVFASAAKQHIGRSLFTSELVGAIIALCLCVLPSLGARRVEPTQKGRWPNARLEAKFPEGFEEASAVGPHALDALKIGLVYLESTNLWEVK